MSINFWNRKQNRLEIEDVYGGGFVSLLYGNPVSLALTSSLLTGKTLSRIYGAVQSSPISGRKIAPFVKRYGIDSSIFESGPFTTFNDFFIRKFLPGKRPFPKEPNILGAFAEARYLGFERLQRDTSLPIKGLKLYAEDVLGHTPGKERFANGPCLLARLCPVDYHRFHFPDSGKASHHHVETGRLHSVNPVALERKPNLFLSNERQITLLETDNFGTLAYVEVGALCVGRIVQSYPFERAFQRGEEKGYFLFGASTVIVYGEPGAWKPEQDVLEHTQQGHEVLVELGQPIARVR